MYADLDYYNNTYNGRMDDDTALRMLDEASYDIDTLTFGRAKNLNMSKFQTSTLARVCCEIADFKNANGQYLNSGLSSYSLNGTSMSFSGDTAGVTTVNNVVIPRSTYGKLVQTGLCCRSLGV